MPAKILLPMVGDSTWALGSHTCKPNTGIFTKNLRIINHLINVDLNLDLKSKSYVWVRIKIVNKHGNENIIV